ncbi:MAG: hypothetical protein AAGI70_08110 [Pseudomonadota bacterium]
MLALYEVIAYAIGFGVLWLIWRLLAERGEDRVWAWIVRGFALVLTGILLTRLDWAYISENWRDLVANMLVGLAVLSLVVGYARLVRVARRRATAEREDGDGQEDP